MLPACPVGRTPGLRMSQVHALTSAAQVLRLGSRSTEEPVQAQGTSDECFIY